MNYIKQNHLSILIILWLVFSPFFGGSQMLGALDRTTVSNPWTFAGAVTHSAAVALTSSFKLGSSGTEQVNQIVTTCNPTANTSIAATSTGYIFCTGVTGVTSSDYVFASFATSTTGIGNNWAIVGSMASTTAGAVDIKIMNLTGGAVVPSVSGTFASSTRLFIAH